MKAGVFQSDGAGLSRADRLEMLEDAIAGQELDVVLCPELFACGYHIGDALDRLAEPADGAFAQAVQALAARTGTAVLYGYAERGGISDERLRANPDAKESSFVVELRFPPDVDSRNQVVIDRVVTDGWAIESPEKP